MEPAIIFSAISLLLTGAIAGFFYAFSVCVMKGLDRIAAPSAITAMKSINESVLNPVFFLTFFITPIAQLTSAYFAHQGNQKLSSILYIAAAVIYISGALIPTLIFNVPMNENLAKVEMTLHQDELPLIWNQYSKRWTKWNTIRTIFSLLSLLVVGAAILLRAA